jgi:hypothetical protein
MIFRFRGIYGLAFFAGAIQLSCKSQEVAVAKEEMSCRDSLKVQLLEYWSYDSAQNTYSGTNGMFLMASQRKKCLREMNQDEIIKFFGKPSLRRSDRLYYFNWEECWQDTVDFRTCHHFSEIRFNEDGYYIWISP